METHRGEAQDQPVENDPDEPGAEGGADTDDATNLPGAPTRDDSEAGDTDQHSSSDS
jgi:hypothetical protein